ncbi:MAG: hypothetical protein IJU69_06665 [Bacteroidales bacterium]|nr:hypothetical protein [Bacteroidales bacterium]
MDKIERLYEITAYTENQVGLLSTVAGMFTRRNLNIEKLLVYPSGMPGIHKFKVQARTTADKARSVVSQLEKKVDVIKAFYYVNEEHSATEMAAVEEFLAEREKFNNCK